MAVAILHKYWIYIYDNKTEEKKKKEGKTATNFQVVPFAANYAGVPEVNS